MTRFLILLPLLCPDFLAAQGSLRQATEGRCWLRVPGESPALKDVIVSSGSATPAPWEKDPAVRERLTDIVFPIRCWDWREITISFTPLADGPVNLVLGGCWEEEKPGFSFRKELLWDNLTAQGTQLQNGSFETTTGASGPVYWKPEYGPYLAPGDWPLANAEVLDGKSVAATWQNRPISQTLQTKAGQKVTLRLHARAATLPGFIPPARLPADSPASRALAGIKRGVNLGNCWDAPPPYSWGIRYSTDDIDRIAAEGFDHIRVPVAWHFNLKPNATGFDIDPTLLTDLEPVLKRALEKKMHVILDWHHFDDLTTNPAAHRARFIASWKTISDHFKSWPPELFLELLNEPRDALTTEVANPIYAETIAAIRSIDPERIILVSPGKWGDIRELEKLRLPDADDRIVVTVHCYEPFYFTHQGAGWVQLAGLRGITYPGPPTSPFAAPEIFRENNDIASFIHAYNTLPADCNPCSANAVRDLLNLAREWSDHFGRPVHLGEFGSHNLADASSRMRYARDVRTLAEERHIPWTLWDWKAGFGYWDSQTTKPLFRAALFE